MQSVYLQGNQTEIVENHRDKCRRVRLVLSRLLFFVPPFCKRSAYVSGRERMYYDRVEKRNGGIVLVRSLQRADYAVHSD